MKFEFHDSIDEYLSAYPQSYILDFSAQVESNYALIDTVLVGCEGGFSDRERKLFDKRRIIKFNSSLILKSQSASCAISSKILLAG